MVEEAREAMSLDAQLQKLFDAGIGRGSDVGMFAERRTQTVVEVAADLRGQHSIESQLEEEEVRANDFCVRELSAISRTDRHTPGEAIFVFPVD